MTIDSGAGVVIVGAGQAGSEMATTLRQRGYSGSITLVGDEPHLPYRRPPLSKAFLAGEVGQDSLYIRPDTAYEKHSILCRTGTKVERIDRSARRVRLFDGSWLNYAILVLATGGQARRLMLPGADALNVHYIRTIDDILRLQAQLQPGKRLVVIGGGYIGLEVAAVATGRGLAVTVLELAPRILARVAPQELSGFYERLHRSHGVQLLTGVAVQALEGGDRVDAVALNDGSRVAADLVVVGIGLVPDTALAEAAGLMVADGIVVDAQGRTSDPSIFAIGDCSFHRNIFYGADMRLESVPSAMEQARVAAGVICGLEVEYRAVPWFWSDQYDVRMQMVGLPHGHDQTVMRGDTIAGSFLMFHLSDGVVTAAAAINRATDFAQAKRLVGERVKVDAARLADEGVPLKSLI